MKRRGLPSSPLKRQSSYTPADHFKQAFNSLNALRRDNVLCDVVLVAGGAEFAAHRAVLGACCPYFYTMFTCELQESKAERIVLQEMDSMVLEQVIHFIYTSEIEIKETNVQDLLSAASLLQLDQVQERCCEFLKMHLSPSNCLGIGAFAERFACSRLQECSLTYAKSRCSAVMQCEEFLGLSPEQVLKLISSDDLNISEERVYEALINWTKHDLGARQEHLSQLMAHVRLALLPKEYLKQIINEDLIENDSACKSFLAEAMKVRPKKLIHGNPKMQPRKGLAKALLVVGGHTRETGNGSKKADSVEWYDFEEEQWREATNMPARRSDFESVCDAVVINSLVYAVIGANPFDLQPMPFIHVYDPIKDMWSQVKASMNENKRMMSVGGTSGSIYAVGGIHDSATRHKDEGVSSIECYDALTNEWSKMDSEMSTSRCGLGVGIIGGCLYAVGGQEMGPGINNDLRSMECYDLEMKTWTSVADMSCCRAGLGVGVLDGLLYAVGGVLEGLQRYVLDSETVLKSVEVYNPQTNQWTPVADMCSRRRYAGVVAHNGLLYVLGGFDEYNEKLTTVEFYNPKTDTWTMLPQSMNFSHISPGVCIIDKPAT